MNSVFLGSLTLFVQEYTYNTYTGSSVGQNIASGLKKM